MCEFASGLSICSKLCLFPFTNLIILAYSIESSLVWILHLFLVFELAIRASTSSAFPQNFSVSLYNISR